MFRMRRDCSSGGLLIVQRQKIDVFPCAAAGGVEIDNFVSLYLPCLCISNCFYHCQYYNAKGIVEPRYAINRDVEGEFIICRCVMLDKEVLGKRNFSDSLACDA